MMSEAGQQGPINAAGISAVEERVSYLLARICHGHRNCVNEALNRLDLHVGQEMFLLCLGEQEGVMQSELADCLRVQQATVTRMLDRMARAGLVERCKDPADRRVSRVYLTDQGRSRLQPIVQMWQEVEAQMLAGFSPEESQQLRHFLLRVYGNLG